MNREIKLRIRLRKIDTGKIITKIYTLHDVIGANELRGNIGYEILSVEQFTGLYDKNGKGLTELYEGDILDEKGEICANIHQKYHKRTTDFIIEKMGTKKWRDTEQKAIRRGWGYAE